MMNEISGYRFPPEIIQQAICLYVRFILSFRDVEDLLAERATLVSYETVRCSGPLGTASGRCPCRFCGVDRDLRDFGQIFVPQLALAGDEFAAQIMQHAVKFELRRAEPA